MIVLERNGYTPFGTFGKLTYEDFSCLTVERPWANNQPLISCIPEGFYKANWYAAPKFANLGDVLAITGNTVSLFPDNIHRRSRILIHPGNTMNDVEGCVAVGDSYGCINGIPGIYNSVLTFNKLVSILKQYGFSGGSLMITHVPNQGIIQ
jgi:hypothetical protein